MKRILLPTDFSNNSENAIRYALDLFKGMSCTFVILNVQKISEYATDDLLIASPGTSIYEAIVADNKARLKAFVEPIEEDYANEDYTFENRVDFDVFVDAIDQAVKRHDIDLIIMGSNGATGAAEVLFGSNTLKVIRQVDHPLLIVPAGYGYTRPENILFTVHKNEDFQRDRIDTLLQLVDIFSSSLHVLEVEESRDTSIDNTQDKVNELISGRSFEFRFLEGLPAPVAVSAYVQLFPVDMHAMFVEKESFLQRFIYGSETHKISYSTRVPLLVLHHGTSA